MSSPLLTTKLYIPSLRHGIISREKLIEQLNTGRESKLILISAPAGYGKTTLLAEWIKQQSNSVCWISLDELDNDLKRFFSYLIASLQTIDITIPESLLAKLIDQRSETVTEFITHLVYQITPLSKTIYLVLDDYHLITNPEIHQGLSYLLENLPPEMHLIIAARSDPLLRLAKLRAQGELCEIRVNDLRFSIGEAAQYFNDQMGLGLTLSDISTLMQKTEGWIVGIQLAGISLQNNPDKHQFVLSFAGDNRFIADYLFDEALHRQPYHIRTFLLQTSILERFNAPLCDAVTQQENSQAILAELDRANLFLVPLDDQRNWYRYHHLFRELLQNRLKQTLPEIILHLHTRASLWFKANNLLADAITHAVDANLINWVVSLTEEMAIHRMYAEELTNLIKWLDRQTEDIFRQHPWLLVARGWAYMNSGRFNVILSTLENIEGVLSSQSYPPALVDRIQGHTSAIRAYYWELTGYDPGSFIEEAENALQLLTERDIHLRTFIAIRLANGLSFIGNLPRAIQVLQEAGNASKAAGDGLLAVTALSEMSNLQMANGQLHQAHKNILKIKDYAEILAKKEGRKPASMGILYRHLSNIKYELNKLPEAKAFASLAVESCQQHGEREALYIAYIVMAKVYFGLGEYRKSDQFLDQAMQIIENYFPNGIATVTNFRNHFHLLQERTDDTKIWVQERGLNPRDDFDYTCRLEYQNYARLLAIQGNYLDALQTINATLDIISKVKARWHWLRAKIIQAKILYLMKKPEEALKAIKAALGMANQEGYIRSFVDEGEVIAQLLYQAAQKGIYPEYCNLLLENFEYKSEKSRSHPDIIESLSKRELEVLHHIAQGCSNQEIAHKLVVSLYTVKSHARNIYGKLGVKNRTEAVAKARLYGLLPED